MTTPVSNASNVPSASATTTADQLATAESDQGLDQNAFLKLLVAQMQNQDPLQPMDNTDFVAQLAQFSNLQQVMGINQNLDTLIAQGQGLQNTSMSQLIGQTVTVNGSTVGLDGAGGAVQVAFDLAAPGADVQISFTDSSGHTVRTMDVGAKNGGVNQINWDGKSDAGVLQPAGAYTVTVQAKTATGAPIPVAQNLTAKVQAVSFAKGFSELALDNGMSVPASDLLQVQSSTTPTNP